MKILRSPVIAGLLVTIGGWVATASGADLSGAWRGTWANSNNRHTGPLRGTFVPLNENQYQADFRGRFFGLLPFRYSVVLDAEPQPDGSIRLQGSAFVSRRYGTFHYDATVREGHFESTYTSCKFQGTFSMDRCGGADQ
ncbi:MAG: hypothetical protein CMJ59_17665 [Planctomycetaceae bacterium]|nr:hypothetical protein [Planctomycetaceae bacterium]